MAVRNVHLFFPLYVRRQNQIWALYIIFLDIFLHHALVFISSWFHSTKTIVNTSYFNCRLKTVSL